MNTDKELTPEQVLTRIKTTLKANLIGANDDFSMLGILQTYGRQQYEKGRQEGKWISVKERLPEESEIVLVYFPSLVRIGYLLNGAWYKYHNEGPNDPLIWPNIIAWQLLPSPPNPDKGGKEKE